jgi:hypothetical protein
MGKQAERPATTATHAPTARDTMTAPLVSKNRAVAKSQESVASASKAGGFVSATVGTAERDGVTAPGGTETLSKPKPVPDQGAEERVETAGE